MISLYHTLLSFVVLTNLLNIVVSTNDLIPVVFIMYGEISTYLLHNMELASRNNPVILLTSNSSEWPKPTNTNIIRHSVIIEDMSLYSKAAGDFLTIYKHLSTDESLPRIEYESRCFQRWLVLRDYMKAKSLSQVFYADSDISIYSSMTEAYKYRKQCSATLSVETQWHRYHYVASGHNSYWTMESIIDLCDFMNTIYKTPSMLEELLEAKLKNHQSTVTDMSLLWLWWVAHKRGLEAGWYTGRPLTEPDGNPTNARNSADDAFNFVKSLTLPAVSNKVNLCNSLDVYNGTLFDHIHGWMGCGSNFTLDLESGVGHPNCIGIAHHMGGVPRSINLDKIQIEDPLTQTHGRMYLLTLHYQGETKEYLQYDVCRTLLLTGDKQIVNPEVKEMCAALIKERTDPMPLYNSMIAGLPCGNHSSYRGGDYCF